jgi:hypothetical protein
MNLVYAKIVKAAEIHGVVHVDQNGGKTMLEETYIQTDNQYSQGIVLDEYHGKLSLCSAGL